LGEKLSSADMILFLINESRVAALSSASELKDPHSLVVAVAVAVVVEWLLHGEKGLDEI
jgi:hypothetical protein